MSNRLPATDAIAWIRGGFERVRREPARWLGMTLVYLVFALILKRIPFLGNFVIVLLTPIMLSGALIAARSGTPAPAPADAAGWARALTIDAVRELFQAFRREDHAFAVVIVCIVTLGLTVLVNIPELLITGGSIVSGLAGANMAGAVQPTTLFGMLVVTVLYLFLAMALFYVVPLTLFGERHAIPAVAESFHGCKQNAGAVALFIAPFLALNLLLMLVFSLWHGIGYGLLATVGLIALPTFVAGLYESYCALFEASSVSATTTLSRRPAP